MISDLKETFGKCTRQNKNLCYSLLHFTLILYRIYVNKFLAPDKFLVFTKMK